MSDFFYYFMLGILFVTVIMPALEEIVQLLLTLGELLKGKLMVVITKLNSEIKEISENDNCKETIPIGFSTVFNKDESESIEDDI